MANDNIEIKITGNSELAQKAIEKVNKILKELSGESEKSSQAVKKTKDSVSELTDKLVGMASGYLTVNLLKSITNEAIQDENALNRMSMALKAIGYTTDSAKNQMIKLSQSIANQTVIAEANVQELIALGLNLGITTDKIKEATEGAIGLSTFGIDVNTAMRGVSMAMSGQYEMLSRYIPALRTANTDAEKAAVFQKAMADGFNNAKGEVNTTGGALQKMTVAINEMKSAFGATLSPMLIFIANLLRGLADNLRVMPDFFKLMMIGGLTALGALIATTKLFGASLTVATGGLSLLIGALVGAAVFIASEWENVQLFFERFWNKLQLGFWQLSGIIIEAVDFAFSYYVDWIDKLIEAFNRLTGAHIQSVGAMKDNLIMSIDEQIKKYKEEEEYLDEKEKKRLLKKKLKEKQDAEEAKKNQQNKKNQKKMDEDEAKDRDALEESAYKTRKYFAEAGAKAFLDSASNEKATFKSVTAAIIRAEADALANKAYMRSVVEFASLNFVGGAALLAAATTIKLMGSQIAGAITGMAEGGIINEPVLGVGASGRRYLLGEAGAEAVVPLNRYNNEYNNSSMVIENLTVQSNNAEDMMSQLVNLSKRSNARIFNR